MHRTNENSLPACMAVLLGIIMVFLPAPKDGSRAHAAERTEAKTIRDHRLLAAAQKEDVEWIRGKLYVDGNQRKPGGNLGIWIFNVDGEGRGITSLFVEQSLKRLVLGFGDDEVTLNQSRTKTMRNLHSAELVDDAIHIQTSEDVYFGDQGCDFDLKFSYDDGMTTERLGLDFCGNVQNTSGTSGRVGFVLDGSAVLDLESYLAASKTRPYWNKIKEHILKYWQQAQ